MSVDTRHHISRLQTSLVLLISNDTAKTKLAILLFLYWGEIMKNWKQRKYAETDNVVPIKIYICSDFNGYCTHFLGSERI